MKNTMGRGFAVAAGAVALAAGAANAELSQIVLQIQAEVNGQVGTFSVPQSAGTWTSTSFFWNLAAPAPILTSTGVQLGLVTNASVFVVDDPIVAINFNIVSTAANTNFTIASPLLSFPTLNNAQGTASAAVSVTDLMGDGATLTPVGGGAYAAEYNGLVPTGTNFATLIDSPVIAGAFSTTTISEDFPGGGIFVPIAGNVDDISARWQFTLSPDDLASGTGVFTVVPAPSALAVVAVGGLLAGRRRR